MIRVSGLKEEVDENVTELSHDGLTPGEQLAEIRNHLLPMIDEQMRCLREDILPQLAAEGIDILSYESLTRREKHNLDRYFVDKVFPVLTPLAVDPTHPFPYISPSAVYFLTSRRTQPQAPIEPIQQTRTEPTPDVRATERSRSAQERTDDTFLGGVFESPPQNETQNLGDSWVRFWQPLRSDFCWQPCWERYWHFDRGDARLLKSAILTCRRRRYCWR